MDISIILAISWELTQYHPKCRYFAIFGHPSPICFTKHRLEACVSIIGVFLLAFAAFPVPGSSKINEMNPNFSQKSDVHFVLTHSIEIYRYDSNSAAIIRSQITWINEIRLKVIQFQNLVWFLRGKLIRTYEIRQCSVTNSWQFTVDFAVLLVGDRF